MSVNHITPSEIFIGADNVSHLRRNFEPEHHFQKFINQHGMIKWLDGIAYNLNATLRPVSKDVMAEVERLNRQYISYLGNLLVSGLDNRSKVYTPHHTSAMQNTANRFNDNPKHGHWRLMNSDRYDPKQLMRDNKVNTKWMDQQNGIRPHETNIDLTLAMPQEYAVYRGWRKDMGTLRGSSARYNH